MGSAEKEGSEITQLSGPERQRVYVRTGHGRTERGAGQVEFSSGRADEGARWVSAWRGWVGS